MTTQEIVGQHPVLAHAKAGGPYGWITPHIAAIASVSEQFTARILILPREEQHFIALIITLMGDKAKDTDHMMAFARSYHRLTRRTLYETFTLDDNPAVINLTPKLKGEIWAPAHYAKLAELFADTQARKTLRHMESIKRIHVKRLSQLPYGYRTAGMLKKIRNECDLDEIAFAISTVRRIRRRLDDRAILASLEKRRDRNIRNWVMAHYEATPFPQAPVEAIYIAGRGQLTPLDTHEKLAGTAREFSNCIRTYLYQVLRGNSYFYRYDRLALSGDDKRSAEKTGISIIELRRAPVIGWVVHEALGPNNKPIKRKHRARIIQAFAEVSIGAAPQAVNPKAWFELS